MGQVNLTDYKNSYIETVKKSVSSLHEQCDKLAKNVSDKEAINNLYITSHSLKGRSQVMGFESIANLAEIIEKNSNDILVREVQADEKFIVFLKDCIDKLNVEFTKIKKRDAETSSA
ncbi:MAG: Hpt domain-containing protein [Candidatus Levybacteria bacterium]|nr:Hpt domain-containing protein [Candidatus Levybacteria bacterium]